MVPEVYTHQIINIHTIEEACSCIHQTKLFKLSSIPKDDPNLISFAFFDLSKETSELV